MDFVKAHGTANDFVVLPDLRDAVRLGAPLVRALCDRRRGLGADGVIRLGAPRDGGDVFMDYRNADGSVVEMCANGIRVAAKHVVDHDLVTPVDDTVRVETRAGPRTVRVHRDPDDRVGGATVDMGPPSFAAAAVGLTGTGDPLAPVEQIAVHDRSVAVSPVSMGNPHAVLRVDDVDDAPVRTLGPALERHARFSARTNVEFAEIVDGSHLRLRVWERGVGETASCGTGVCAAVVALHRRELVGRDVEVTVPGGTLRVVWDERGAVRLTGPAVEVAHGRLDRAWVEAVDDGTVSWRLDTGSPPVPAPAPAPVEPGAPA